MSESLRLLVCHQCKTADPVPWCGEEAQCHHPLCNDTLNARMESHYTDSGHSHLVSLAAIDKEAWATQRGRDEILKQAMEVGGGSFTPVLGQEMYEVGQNYEVEAIACWKQHGKPGSAHKYSCEDYMSDKKTLLADTRAERKEAGLSTRQANRTGTKLCQFCPYNSTVMQRVRADKGFYDFKG